MFLLDGIAGFLFRPMALAVIFAMASSFLLSRTLVPTMAMFLLKPHVTEKGPGDHPEDAYLNHHEGDQAIAAPKWMSDSAPASGGSSANPARRRGALVAAAVTFQRGFEHRFAKLRDAYHAMLAVALGSRKAFVIGFLGFVLASFALVPLLGRTSSPRRMRSPSPCMCVRRWAPA